MKRIASLLLVALMVFGFAGCGKEERIMYNSANLSKAVKLADYKNITVDTSSKEFEEMYNSVILSDIQSNELYAVKKEGKIEEGDIANIDYVGKKNGVAFEGGTANGYDLEIGSNTFIEGFEEGLIGANIGETVDLNLTFPKNYQSEDLAGQAVVFTVKVNSAKTMSGVGPEQIYEELGFKSVKEYEKSTKDTAIKNYLYNEIIENSKVNDYPEKDAKFLKDQIISMFETQLKSYGMTLDSYITQNNMTKDSFDKYVLENEAYPMMDETMALYAIIDKEKETVTQEDIDNKIKEIIKEQGDSSVTEAQLKEYYGEFYFETMVARDKALEIVKKNAKIK
ncbi:MAG: FKBP-type peptidyl-prolyl cis-trans isomerase [Clostridia bacterium]|nr:FKBP-type peptidyl-prolyl cis-trans isomerase [Clostridia bacterium]